MLEFIRKYLGSVIVKAILLLVAFTFVLFFGIGDVINRLAGKDYAVRVGEIKISPHEFQVQYNRKMDFLRHRLNNPDAYDKLRTQMLGAFISQMIEELMLNRVISHWDLEINEEVVKLTLQNIAEFKDENGLFSADKLRSMLAQQQLPESMFLESLRINTARSLVFLPISLAIFEPPDVIENLKKVALEQRNVDIVHIYNSAIHNNMLPKPTEAELRDHYQENRESFAIPESKDVTVLVMDETKVFEGIKVSDKEISDEYQSKKTEKGEDWNEPLDKVKSAIIFEIKQRKMPDEAKVLAAKIEDEIGSTKDLGGLALKYGLKILRIKGLSANNTDIKTGKVAISLPYGGDIAGIAFNGSDTNVFQETSHGVQFLVVIDKTFPAYIPEYEKTKDKVLTSWQHSARAKASGKIASDFVSKVSSGVSFEKLARNKHLTVDRIASLSRSGIDGLDNKQSKLTADLVNKIFNAPVGQAVSCAIDGGYIVAYVKDRHYPNLNEKQARKFKSALHDDMVRDVFAQLIKYYQKKTKVDINQSVIKNYAAERD